MKSTPDTDAGRHAPSRAGRLCARAAALALAAGALVHLTAPAVAEPRYGEYEIKAAFLYNFARFVEWHDAERRVADAPLVFAVLGDDPFGEILDWALHGKRVRGRRIEIRRSPTLSELAGPQLLFISSSERDRLEEILERLEGREILTIGDFERFAERGGMIGFVVDQRQVRFNLNLRAARRAGIRISSSLIKVARLVEELPAAPEDP